MTDDATARLARQTTIAAVLCVVGLALAGVWIWTQRPQLAPIEVSQQTTYIVTPTRADGWVDYPEAIDWMRRASLDAGGANAAIPLLRALGQNVLPAGVDRGAILKRLGITEPPAESSALTSLRDFGAADGAGGQEPPPATMEWLRARCGGGQRGRADQASFARIQAWLARSDASLSDLRTASHSSGLYVPVPRDPRTRGDFIRVAPARLVNAAEALGCRAAVALLQGNAPASWADVEAIWRLGMLVARSASAGEYALGEAFWKTALTGTADLAASPATTPELLSAMQAGLGKLGFAPATETWMFHRLAALDAASALLVPSLKPGARPMGPLARPGTGATLEAINQQFDMVEIAMQADPKQRIARVDQVVPTTGQLGVVGRNLLGVEIQAVSYQRLAPLAVALAKWRREKGSVPATLTELGPLAKDPGSGGDFTYGPSGQQFRLHGVGGDGRDDAGDPGKDVVVTSQEPPRLSAR